MADEKLDRSDKGDHTSSDHTSSDDTSAAEGDLKLRDKEAENVKGGMTKQEFVTEVANRSQ